MVGLTGSPTRGARFVHCPEQGCGRLLLAGQRCVCVAPTEVFDCDCTHVGNVEHTGPRCRARVRQAWAMVMTFRPGRPLPAGR